MTIRIGFPATLFFFSYFPFWQTFFNYLGCQVVTSPLTTKQILDAGAREAVNDACIPIKVFHGHVLALKDKVDVLFVPRMVRIIKSSTFCPKFLGLPDMVRACLADLPPLIDLKIDCRRGRSGLWATCLAIGKLLNKSQKLIQKAFREALSRQQAFEQLLKLRYLPQAAINKLAGQEAAPAPQLRGLHIAVLGYPYQVHDPYLSLGLIAKLQQMGITVWTTEMIPSQLLYKLSGRLPKRVFWYFSNLVLGAMYYYLGRQNISGIIHVTAFGCGPDAMVDKLMEIETRLNNSYPFMSLCIDEQTGDAGLATRVEAFVDMLEQKERRI